MKPFFAALLAASMLTAPVASAQPPGAFDVAQAQHRQIDKRVEKRVEKTIEKRVIVEKRKSRFQRGARLTRAERRAVINARDYRRYKLRQPGRGQQWVRVDNTYLLVSLATGVIVGLATTR